ncbi:MAG TPA: hypothetical protein VJG32_17260 [Anaerolineae bacterium]|nr:hypothetical protein [Anaerolineae bacterium]
MTTRKRKSDSDRASWEDALARELSGVRRAPPTRARSGVERRVRDVLIPVEPSQQFVSELGRSLTTMALRSRQSLIQRYRTAILIGAAVFGSIASVVGVVALIMRQRSRAA